MLEEANTQYAAGKLTLAAATGRQADKIAPVVTELLDYATMAVGSVAAFMNPEIIVLAGRIVGGGDLVLDVLRHRLKGNVYDPPRSIGALGTATSCLGRCAWCSMRRRSTLPTASWMSTKINRSRLTAIESGIKFLTEKKMRSASCEAYLHGRD
jgi:predicted NBD/HSP70 family sugar kinase